MTLEEVLANAREEATILDRHGHKHDGDLLRALCDKVQASAYEYLNWLSEGEAKLRSGHSAAFLRARFPGWLAQGLARWEGKKRQYRAVVVPQRGNREAAKEAGRRAGAA